MVMLRVGYNELLHLLIIATLLPNNIHSSIADQDLQIETDDGNPIPQHISIVIITVLSLCSLAIFILLCSGCWPTRFFRREGGSTRGFANPISDLEGGGGGSLVLSEIDVRALEHEQVVFEPLPTIKDLTPLKKTHEKCNRLQSSSGVIVPLSNDSQIYAHDWFDEPFLNFPRGNLEYIKVIGKGWFGQVIEADARELVSYSPTLRVIVKVLSENSSELDQMRFLDESRLYRDSSSPHILKLLAHSIETNPLLLIYDYFPLGDLKSHLLSHLSSAELLYSRGDIIRMGLDVGKALEWMSSAGFTHGDIAARNCMVGSDGRVVLGDYGLSSDKFRDDYYWSGNIAVPLRWAAPETLHCTLNTIQTLKVTPESNIWTFGIFLWELFEFGKMPYPNLSDEEVLTSVIVSKSTTLPPPSMPPSHLRHSLHTLMTSCWSFTPSQRTPINILVSKLEEVLEEVRRRGGRSEEGNDEEFEKKWERVGGKEEKKRTVSFQQTTPTEAPILPLLAQNPATSSNFLPPNRVEKDPLTNPTTTTSPLFDFESTSTTKKDKNNSVTSPLFNFETTSPPKSANEERSGLSKEGLNSLDYWRAMSEDGAESEWRSGIERGEISEKVRLKSQSVQDLMILTHVEPSELMSDSESLGFISGNSKGTQLGAAGDGISGENAPSSPQSLSTSNNIGILRRASSETALTTSPPKSSPIPLILTPLGHETASPSHKTIQTSSNTNNLLVSPFERGTRTIPTTPINLTGVQIQVTQPTPSPRVKINVIQPSPQPTEPKIDDQIDFKLPPSTRPPLRIVFKDEEPPSTPHLGVENGRGSSGSESSFNIESSLINTVRKNKVITGARHTSTPLVTPENENSSSGGVYEWAERSSNNSQIISSEFEPSSKDQTSLISSITTGSDTVFSSGVLNKKFDDSSGYSDDVFIIPNGGAPRKGPSRDFYHHHYTPNEELHLQKNSPFEISPSYSPPDSNESIGIQKIMRKLSFSSASEENGIVEESEISEKSLANIDSSWSILERGLSKIDNKSNELGLFDNKSTELGLFGNKSNELGLFDNKSNELGLFDNKSNELGLFDNKSNELGLFDNKSNELGLFDNKSNELGLFDNKSNELGLFDNKSNELGLFDNKLFEKNKSTELSSWDVCSEESLKKSNATWDDFTNISAEKETSLFHQKTEFKLGPIDNQGSKLKELSKFEEDIEEANEEHGSLRLTDLEELNSNPPLTIKDTFPNSFFNENESNLSLVTRNAFGGPVDKTDILSKDKEEKSDVLCEDGEKSVILSHPFTPSKWDSSMNPKKSAIKSPDPPKNNAVEENVRNSIKKSVSFERPKTQLVYEYPPNPIFNESDDEEKKTKLFNLQHGSLDWELEPDELGEPEMSQMFEWEDDIPLSSASKPLNYKTDNSIDLYRISAFDEAATSCDNIKVKEEGSEVKNEPQWKSLGELRHTRDKLRLDLSGGNRGEGSSGLDNESSQCKKLDSGVGSSPNVSPLTHL